MRGVGSVAGELASWALQYAKIALQYAEIGAETYSRLLSDSTPLSCYLLTSWSAMRTYKVSHRAA